MHSETALWYQIGKDLAFQGFERAFLAQCTVQFSFPSLSSSATCCSIKKLPAIGISTRSLRYSNLRVALLDGSMICPLPKMSQTSRDETAQGRYFVRKAVVRQATTARARQATTLIIYNQLQQLSCLGQNSSLVAWGEWGVEQILICYQQMNRGQVYNATRWDPSEVTPSRETTRRLDRRIKQNMGILDRSRQSNHSTSMRMKRTEMSGERASISRERELNSQQTSGFTTDPFNDSTRRIPRKMGSVLSLSHRRQGNDNRRIPAAGSRSGKNIVQNLYMLTNNVPQYPQNRQHYPNPKQEQESRYSQRYPRNQYQRPQPYPQYSEQKLDRYPERSQNRNPDRSQDKYREESYASRDPTPTRGSILRSKRSKDNSSARGDRVQLSRDKGYKHIGSNRDVNRGPDAQIKKLEEKYMENIYQLNNPKGRGRADPKGDRRDRGYREQYREEDKGKVSQNRRDQNSRKNQSPRVHDPYASPRADPYSPRSRNDRAKKDRNRYYPDNRDPPPYPQHYPDSRNSRPYPPEERQYNYREDRGYQDRLERHYVEQDARYEQRDERYRNEGSSRQGPYRDRRDVYRNESSRGNNYNMQSNYSGKSNPYYYQDQIPSTTAGVKTLPEMSRHDTISDVPINSIGSFKQMPRNNAVEQLPAKNSVKLDKSRGRPVRPKDKSRDPRYLGYGESNIDERWQKNNIKLEERPQEKWDHHKQKILEDSAQPGSLPTGSMFLPVQSKRYEAREWEQEILEKVIMHLQILNLIADYTKDFKKMYQNVEPWQVLIFLTYKKFYIERTKATNALRSASTKVSDQSTSSLHVEENPFKLPYSKISEEELVKFRETKECFALLIELEGENTKIRNALRGLYNLYIQKSGQHVNMLDCDNFSEEIYKLMVEELEGISDNLNDTELVTLTRIRMGKIIKVGLLTAFLNGKYVRNFPQILIHDDMIKVGKRQTLRQDSLSHLFLNEFKYVLSS